MVLEIQLMNDGTRAPDRCRTLGHRALRAESMARVQVGRAARVSREALRVSEDIIL